MKESKHISPVGLVPRDWMVQRLDTLADIAYGIGDPIDRSLVDGVKIISLPNVTKDGEFKLDDVPLVARENVQERDILRNGDILFNWRNGSVEHLGKTAFFDLSGTYTHVGFLLRVRSKGNVVPRYLDLYIKFLHMRGFFLTCKFQVNNTFNKEELSEVATVMPPHGEQQKIADTIELWDGAISNERGQLNAALDRKRGLMHQLLTGRKRFKEFVTSMKQVRTQFGPFPADWPIVCVGDMADEVAEKNDAGHELPVLSCTKYRGLVNSLEYFGKRIFSKDTSGYRVVRRGDFAYATNHIEEGSIGYQNLHDAALISPMYTVFRMRAGVDHSFFFKLVKTELYRHIFETNTNGSINRRGALRWADFARIKVHLPGMREQRRIAAVLEVCDREIKLLQKQLEALKEQKRGLMQKLLTGEVRVKAGGSAECGMRSAELPRTGATSGKG